MLTWLFLVAFWAFSTVSHSVSIPMITDGPKTLFANVEELQTVIVRGTGFVPGANISCKVVDAPYDGMNFCPYCTPPCIVPRPGRVINESAATCVVGNSGYAASSGLLQFSYDNKTWQHGKYRGWGMDFVPLLDVAVGKRPYYSSETMAELIILLAAGLEESVQVCVSSPEEQMIPKFCTEVSPTEDGRGTALPFSLDKMPANVNTTVDVSFSYKGFHGKTTRLFVRAEAPATGNAVVVDHRHRGLRLNGDLWLGVGYYWPAMETFSHEYQRNWMFYLSQQGVTQVELGLDSTSQENATTILGIADEFGIKVQFSVVRTVDRAMNCSSTSCDSEAVIKSRLEAGLWKIVDAHRNSTALLSWYICDDCPCGGGKAEEAKRRGLAYVYSLLKAKDPWHVTSGAGGCGNMYSLGEPYALSLDQIMYENYNPDPISHFGGGTYPTKIGWDGGLRHYPITFEPLCNMAGFYMVYNTHQPHPPHSLPQVDQESLAWASTITAGMPYQMYFALEPPKYGGPQGIAAVGRFSRAVQAMKGLILQDMTGGIVSMTLNSSGRVIGRAWLQQGSEHTNSSWCAVLAVVNGEIKPVSYTVSLPFTNKIPSYVTSAQHMLPFEMYSVPLQNGTLGMAFTDVIPASGVSLLRLSAPNVDPRILGCPQLSAVAQTRPLELIV